MEEEFILPQSSGLQFTMARSSWQWELEAVAQVVSIVKGRDFVLQSLCSSCPLQSISLQATVHVLISINLMMITSNGDAQRLT